MSTLLNYSDHPDGRFGFLHEAADTMKVASRIGRHMPDEHARRLISCVIDDFLALVDALYDEGWEDLLARLQVAFEIKGQPLDALRERNNGRVPDFPDLLGQLRDSATVPGTAGGGGTSQLETVSIRLLPSGTKPRPGAELCTLCSVVKLNPASFKKHDCLGGCTDHLESPRKVGTGQRDSVEHGCRDRQPFTEFRAVDADATPVCERQDGLDLHDDSSAVGPEPESPSAGTSVEVPHPGGDGGGGGADSCTPPPSHKRISPNVVVSKHPSIDDQLAEFQELLNQLWVKAIRLSNGDVA